MKKYKLSKFLKDGDPNLANVVSLCLVLAEFEISEEILKQLPERFHKYFEEK